MSKVHLPHSSGRKTTSQAEIGVQEIGDTIDSLQRCGLSEPRRVVQCPQKAAMGAIYHS